MAEGMKWRCCLFLGRWTELVLGIPERVAGTEDASVGAHLHI